MPAYVAYTCQIEDDFRRPQLSLAAQECDISFFLNGCTPGNHAIEYFTDYEDGPVADRISLAAAVDLCRRTGATLLVARVEVLPFDDSAFASFCDQLDMRVAAMPAAQTAELLIHTRLLSQERRFDLSHARQIAQLGDEAREPARTRQPDNLSKIAEIVFPLRAAGATMNDIASALNRMGLTTARGTAWRARHISNVLTHVDRYAGGRGLKCSVPAVGGSGLA